VIAVVKLSPVSSESSLASFSVLSFLMFIAIVKDSTINTISLHLYTVALAVSLGNYEAYLDFEI
jgi:hypothetical protein